MEVPACLITWQWNHVKWDHFSQSRTKLSDAHTLTHGFRFISTHPCFRHMMTLMHCRTQVIHTRHFGGDCEALVSEITENGLHSLYLLSPRAKIRRRLLSCPCMQGHTTLQHLFPNYLPMMTLLFLSPSPFVGVICGSFFFFARPGWWYGQVK